VLYFSVFSDNVFSRLLLHPPCFFIFGVIAKIITQHVKKGCQWQPFDSVSGEAKVTLILNSTKSTVETLRNPNIQSLWRKDFQQRTLAIV
jgi:hypothetical protein